MAGFPFYSHSDPSDVVARRAGVPMTAAAFTAEAHAIASSLPDRRYLINLCRDRLNFALVLAAGLLRCQVNLLPGDLAPATLQDLAADYPDSYELGDSGGEAGPRRLILRIAEAAPWPGSAPCFPAEQPAVILFTSGSTGRPMPAAKDWGTLIRASRAAGTGLGVAAHAGGTVFGTVPHQHSYGLESTVLLPLQHGLVLDCERLLLPGDICRALAGSRPSRILVTTPTHLRALVGDRMPVPPVELTISATSPLSHQLAVQAEARLGGALREIYGCSEAGQLAHRRTASGEDWHCMAGMDLRQDASGTWARSSPCSPYVLLNDDIELTGHGRFRLHGRLADLVNVAGKRSSLAYLNAQLLAIDGVADGMFLLPEDDGTAVPRLAAFAVAPGMTREGLLAALRRRIDPAFLPRPLRLVDALPRNALGKVTNLAARALAKKSA